MPENVNVKIEQIGFLRAQYASIAFEQEFLGLESYFCYGLLTHYTTLESLIGIVESGGFWLSDIRFLNDADEFHHGRDLALDLIGRLINRSRYQSFVDILNAAATLLRQPIEKPYYVASFSRDPDSLEQWRAYAPGSDGVALVFENKPLRDNPFMAEPRVHSAAAIYDDLKKRRVLLNTISRFAIEYKRELLSSNRVLGEAGLWAHHLVETLTNAFLTFKNQAFKTENEVRVIAYAGQIEKVGSQVRHRVRGGRVVPYVNSSIFHPVSAEGRTPLPLREVIVGPVAAQDVTIASVRTFLANTGYKDVLVRPSAIPFRG